MERQKRKDEEDYRPSFYHGASVKANLSNGKERVWVPASIRDSREAIPRGVIYTLQVSSDRQVPECLRNKMVELEIKSRGEEETRIRWAKKSFS